MYITTLNSSLPSRQSQHRRKGKIQKQDAIQTINDSGEDPDPFKEKSHPFIDLEATVEHSKNQKRKKKATSDISSDESDELEDDDESLGGFLDKSSESITQNDIDQHRQVQNELENTESGMSI